MRDKVRMTFWKSQNRRGFKGHWCMDYYVEDVQSISTGEIICKDYVFKDSVIFKGLGLKQGDIVEMDININKESKKSKLTYYRNVRKIKSGDDFDK